MKVSIKKLSVLLIFALIISMVGCVEPHHPTEQKPSDVESTQTTEQKPNNNEDNQIADIKDLDAGVFSPGNWSTDFGTTFGEGGYYYCGSFQTSKNATSRTCFVDLSNGVSVFLCSKVGCPHVSKDGKKVDDCEAAFGSNNEPFFVRNGGIYYTESWRGDGCEYLCYRDSTGQAARDIAVLGEPYVNKEHSLSIYNYILAGDLMYYEVSVGKRIFTGPNEATVQDALCAIMRVDLSSGKQEVLFELPAEWSFSFIAAREDAVLLKGMRQPTELDFSAEDFRDQLVKLPTCILQWTEADGKVTSLMTSTIEKLSSVDKFHDGIIYCIGYYDQTYSTLDLSTGKTAETALPSCIFLGEKYILYYEDNSFRIMDIQKGEDIPLEIENAGFNVSDVGSEGVILEKFYYKEGTDPDAIMKDTDRTVTCYVRFDSLSDGLQEEDCLDFHTE